MKKQTHLTAAKRLSFGRYCKRLRETSGLTLRAASKQIGCISFSGLYAIEQGESFKIGMDLLAGMTKAYNCDYDALCLKAERMPKDVYYKILGKPELYAMIRGL